MPDLARRLDDFLIDRVAQPGVNLLHARIGATPARMAVLCYRLMGAMFFVVSVHWSPGLVPHGPSDQVGAIPAFVVSFVLILLGWWAMSMAREMARRGRSTHAGMAPKERVTELNDRMCSLLYIAVLASLLAIKGETPFSDLDDLLWSIAALAHATGRYLSACRVVPPSWRTATWGRFAPQGA